MAGRIKSMSDRYASIADNILHVQERIAKAAERAGRKYESIRLMAVTKFHPQEAILSAWKAGIRLFGENRVQEAAGKYPLLRSHISESAVHMIGTLQKNKINKALAVFDAIQSIDSIELLEAVAFRIANRTEPLDLYFELHTGEESKSGFPDIESLLRAAETYADITAKARSGAPQLRLKGLMTMAPYTSDAKALRASFRTLAHAFEEIRKRFDFSEFSELSMGMSNDFEIAIEEGSTIVRIGTAIFGERQDKDV